MTDLDDVLNYTNRHFLKYLKRAVKKLISEMELKGERAAFLRKKFYNLNIEMFKTHGVVRERWRHILELLQEDFPELTEKVIEAVLPIFQLIYKTAPELREDAAVVMTQLHEFAHELGFPLAILTHADEETTQVKSDAYNLPKFFYPIKSVPANGKKDKQAFADYIHELGLEPKSVIVIEDNWHNIMEAIAAGVLPSHIIWFRGPETPDFGQNGRLPKGVNRLKNLSLLPALVKKIVDAELEEYL